MFVSRARRLSGRLKEHQEEPAPGQEPPVPGVTEPPSPGSENSWIFYISCIQPWPGEEGRSEEKQEQGLGSLIESRQFQDWRFSLSLEMDCQIRSGPDLIGEPCTYLLTQWFRPKLDLFSSIKKIIWDGFYWLLVTPSPQLCTFNVVHALCMLCAHPVW